MKLKSKEVLLKILGREIRDILKCQKYSEDYLREEKGSYVLTGWGYFPTDGMLMNIQLLKLALGMTDKEFDKLWEQKKKEILLMEKKK